MIKNKVCPVCEEPFTTHTNCQTYCSKTCRAIVVQQRYMENKDKTNAANRKHYRERKEYEKKIIEKDQIMRARSNLRRRIKEALAKRDNPFKNIDSLGCSSHQLKLHLESLFAPGMTWENYGAWHVDHIKPLASFDLTDKEQFRKASHYTNLQPLWAKDNLKKGARIDD